MRGALLRLLAGRGLTEFREETHASVVLHSLTAILNQMFKILGKHQDRDLQREVVVLSPHDDLVLLRKRQPLGGRRIGCLAELFEFDSRLATRTLAAFGSRLGRMTNL